MNWESLAPGDRHKAYVEGNQRIRLVEVSDEHVAEDWCDKGHIGYVLEGRISIDFNGRTITFNEGDGIFIPKGEENRHKAKVAKGEKVLMILFEEV